VACTLACISTLICEPCASHTHRRIDLLPLLPSPLSCLFVTRLCLLHLTAHIRGSAPGAARALSQLQAPFGQHPPAAAILRLLQWQAAASQRAASAALQETTTVLLKDGSGESALQHCETLWQLQSSYSALSSSGHSCWHVCCL
jgi:hypothetical protein